MYGSITGSFSIDLRDFDTILLLRTNRRRDSGGIATLNNIARLIFESEGWGSAKARYDRDEKLAKVSYISTSSLEDIKDTILVWWNSGSRDDRAENISRIYEKLEVLRFGVDESVDVRRALVEICLARRDRVRAYKHFQHLRRQGRMSPSTRILLGRLQLAFGSPTDAIESFRKAFKEDPLDVESGRRLLHTIVRLGRKRRHIQKLASEILKRDSDNPEALFVTAMLRFEDKLDKDGEALLRRIVDLNDSPPIEEYAWKAWVELNKRFSQEMMDEVVLRISNYIEEFFSIVTTMNRSQKHELLWQIFKTDFHSWTFWGEVTTYSLDFIGDDVPLECVVAILWIICSTLLPRPKIGLRHAENIEKWYRIERKVEPFTDIPSYRLVRKQG
jgi:tetratricopeptide (TPR) repeat protein